jgi:low temperature requirement protein LtrA
MSVIRIRAPLSARDPDEPNRTATPLELFFDLTFVVAIAQAANSLHHGFADGHASDVLITYPMVFFAIWWAWMNFTWFASAYDTDGVAYRLLVFVQIAGVLVLAAGAPRAMDERDFGVAVLGYVIMRVGLVANWLRAAAADPGMRQCCRRYAAGVVACQLGWIGLFALPDGLWLPGFVVLAACELAVPVWAERVGVTPWHPRHIAERYGLFTIIVLGESVLAASFAVQGALDAGDKLAELGAIAFGGLLTVFAMWWVYFDQPAEHVVERARRGLSDTPRAAFLWGYGHYVVFASAAATGAGIALAVDQAAGHSALSDPQAALAVTIPVCAYLLAVWALHARDKQPGPLRSFAVPVSATLVLASTLTPEPVLVTGIVMAGLVAVAVVVHDRETERAAAASRSSPAGTVGSPLSSAMVDDAGGE